jgi:hypothetical protein
MVKCAFGILANKWRIFHRSLVVTPRFCDSIVKAFCILHSFISRNDGLQLKDTLYESNFDSIQATGRRGNTTGKHVRDFFTSILLQHMDLCLGSTIKYDLESDIP